MQAVQMLLGAELMRDSGVSEAWTTTRVSVWLDKGEKRGVWGERSPCSLMKDSSSS